MYMYNKTRNQLPNLKLESVSIKLDWDHIHLTMCLLLKYFPFYFYLGY